MLPTKTGRFGRYGGVFVPETLMPAVIELEEAYRKARKDREFQRELTEHLKEYAGRPTSLYYAERLTRRLGGARIYLKREDLAHTGAHKINNTLGQVLLAKKMKKTRIIAETGAGMHGVATATAAARFGLECIVYMGTEDIRRQAMNVHRMELLGARVEPVEKGSRTLKDAINEAIRDWVTNVATTHYVIGSVVGPHPYPMMVRDFQSVIGKEVKTQMKRIHRALPDVVVACVGGGSNAMGLFYPFVRTGAEMVGVEAAGKGLSFGKHSASLTAGQPGILHGALSFLLQTRDGQIKEAHSVAAGLDYPGTGPEHAHLKDSGRAKYVAVTDHKAMKAFKMLSELEGIIPALESAHAVAYAVDRAPKMPKNKAMVICLSGRGDKDLEEVRRLT